MNLQNGLCLPHRHRRGQLTPVLAVIAATVIAGCTITILTARVPEQESADGPNTPTNVPSDSFQHAVVIKRPVRPRVDLGSQDATGQPLTADCSTCHRNRQANAQIRDSGRLIEFHQGLKYSHGHLNCVACHNAEDYDSLRLADGRPLPFGEVMTLCGQCHGNVMRDYEHGAHGGMNGHWDLSRGPRSRKNCVDCHDPHAPAFPLMKPTFKSKDRFLTKPHSS